MQLELRNDDPVSVGHLVLPPGSYLIWTDNWFRNRNNAVFQDNTRNVQCTIDGEIFREDADGGFTDGTASWHRAAIYGSGTTVDVACRVANGPLTGLSDVWVFGIRLTAQKLDAIHVQ